jgi:cell division protein FtsB
MMVRWSIAAFLLAAVLLQYKYWFSETGFFQARVMEGEVARERQVLVRLNERNRILKAEVLAQKNGLEAVEARARSDLGMIKPDETFYLLNRPRGGS